MSDIFEVIAGARPAGRADRPTPTSPGPRLVIARVHSVTPAGIRYVVPSWDEGRFVWGPARFSSVAGPPVEGVDCIVAFVPNSEGGVDNWVLAWEGSDLHVTLDTWTAFLDDLDDRVDALTARVTSLEAAPGGVAGVDPATFWMDT